MNRSAEVRGFCASGSFDPLTGSGQVSDDLFFQVMEIERNFVQLLLQFDVVYLAGLDFFAVADSKKDMIV